MVQVKIIFVYVGNSVWVGVYWNRRCVCMKFRMFILRLFHWNRNRTTIQSRMFISLKVNQWNGWMGGVKLTSIIDPSNTLFSWSKDIELFSEAILNNIATQRFCNDATQQSPIYYPLRVWLLVVACNPSPSREWIIPSSTSHSLNSYPSVECSITQCAFDWHPAPTFLLWILLFCRSCTCPLHSSPRQSSVVFSIGCTFQAHQITFTASQLRAFDLELGEWNEGYELTGGCTSSVLPW